MLFLYITGSVVLALTVSLLLFRIHVKGEISKSQSALELVCVWFAAKMDFKSSKFSGRIFFVHLPLKKRKKSPKSEVSFNNKPAPRKRPIKQEEFKETVTPEPKGEPERIKPVYQTHSTKTEHPERIPKVKKAISRKKIKAETTKKKSFSEGKDMLKLLWAERKLAFDIIRRLVSGTVGLIKKIRTDYLRLNLEFGAGDPATTGIIYGILQPVRIMNNDRIQFVTIPDFEEERIEADFSCSFSIVPVQVVFVIAKEVYKFPWIRLAWTSWSFYKQKKNKPTDSSEETETQNTAD
ncbi:MAG: DUF2953 domain-containing protein [Calditrichaeota bacterium]|nr:DUF2953 domain-containing protein [Calditrichota bacterium]